MKYIYKERMRISTLKWLNALKKMEFKRKETIKFCVAMLILIIIISIVVSIIIKYQVTGETNMPFQLEKITVISTAEGNQNEENPDNVKWNLSVHQNNDIYFYVSKNEDVDETSLINSVSIENINITKQPQIGTIKAYMPNSGEGRRFLLDDSFLISDSLTYTGDKQSDEKNLTIGNQGGVVPIRIANCNIGEYISDEDAEIVHDGTLLKIINIRNRGSRIFS